MLTKYQMMMKTPFYSILLFVAIPALSLLWKSPENRVPSPDTPAWATTGGDCDTLLCGMTVVTCHADTADPTLPVAAVIDSRFNSQAPAGDDWANPQGGGTAVSKIMPSTWTVGNLGQVFGTAIDATGNVFLAASDVYNFHWYAPGPFPSAAGPAGSGGIYRAEHNCLVDINPLVTTTNIDNDNTTGAARIPNTGGLGNGIANIAIDPLSGNLYATNLEDGRIYRINPNSGVVLSIYDPFDVDVPGSPGRVDAKNRLWGLNIWFNPATGENRLYYDRDGSFDNSFSSAIYSVELDPVTGEFQVGQNGGGIFVDANPQLEIADVHGTLPAVTDISFSRHGEMLVAERGFPHSARVSLYELSGGAWSFVRQYFVGVNSNGTNSAGGVDFLNAEINEDLGAGCDSLIWASGNYMNAAQLNPFDYVYGLQGIPVSGNAPGTNNATDIFVDFDGQYSTLFKGGIGDVEVYRCECNQPGFPCAELDYSCDELGGDGCCYELNLVNPFGPGSQFTVTGVELEMLSPDWIFNTGSLQIAAGYNWTIPPTNNRIRISHNSGQLPGGNLTDVLDFCISPAQPNPSVPQQLVLKWYSLDANEQEVIVCTDTLVKECSIEFSENCVVIDEFTVDCNPDNPYEYLLNFSVTNLSPNPVTQLLLQDITAGFGFSGCSASNFLPSLALNLSPSPLLPGATSNSLCVKVVSGSPILNPELIFFRLGVISDEYCCHASNLIPVTLAPCCDPCEANGIIVNDLDATDDACCYSLDVINNCRFDFFSKIETEIITPGVLFGYHGLGGPDAPNWTIGAGSSDTSITWIPNGGSVPSDTIQDLIQFCLDDINDPSEVPQQVLVKWYTTGCFCQDSLVCVDTLTFNCEVDYPCLEVSERELECDEANQQYQYTFTVTNTSGIPFTATDIFVQVDDPADVILTPTGGLFPLTPPLATGQSATISTGIESTAGWPPPSGYAVLRYRLAFFNAFSADTCCFENRVDTLFFPPCDVEPDCSQLSVLDVAGDSCCYSLDLENQYPAYLSTIEIESITPGAAFGSHFPGGPDGNAWNSTQVSPTLIQFTRSGGQIPPGQAIDLVNFCFDQNNLPNPPYEVEVRWLDDFGLVVCTEILSLECSVETDDLCGSGPLVVNNGLTPNGDGFNDEFVVNGLTGCEGVDLTIYNRWGNVVYEQPFYEAGPNWTGLGANNQILPDGTYFYLLDFTELGVQRTGFLDLRN